MAAAAKTWASEGILWRRNGKGGNQQNSIAAAGENKQTGVAPGVAAAYRNEIMAKAKDAKIKRKAAAKSENIWHKNSNDGSMCDIGSVNGEAISVK